VGLCYRCVHNPSCKCYTVTSLILLHLTGYSALLQQVLILSILAFFGGNMLLGMAYFAPTIIRSMGYSPIRTQLMSVPPYAATFVISVAVAILSDRWGQRGYCLLFSGILAFAGYIIFYTSTDTAVLYGSIVLQTVGAFTGAPAATTWIVNNVQPHYKRSTAIGLVTSMANFGGILSAWIYDGPPKFRKATKINLASSIGLCVLAVVTRVWLVMQNKRKEEERARRQRLESEEEEAERRRLGDTHPDFIYTL
jgi:predicted MFS family arabinose efflux permease